MEIDRAEFKAFVTKAALAFTKLKPVKGAATNDVADGIEKLVNGCMQALTAALGKKPAGEIKTDILNHIRDTLGISADIDSPALVEDWEQAAVEAYNRLYEARKDKRVLLCAASRLMRKLPIYEALPKGTVDIHYKPDKKIIERFYSKLEAGDFGSLATPDNARCNGVKCIMKFGGGFYEELMGLGPMTLQDYFEQVAT